MIAQAYDPLKVLLVEDNAADARLVREMLRDEDAVGTTVTHAQGMAEALICLKRGGFNVVLLDLALPDSDGIDTFARAHAEAPSAPIVVLTGLADMTLAATAVRHGAQDYLVKGQVNGRELHRSLRHAVARRAAEDALRASEERFRQVVENIKEAFVVVDVPSLEVQYVSRIWEHLWGRPLIEAYEGPTHWLTLVVPEDRPLLRDAVESVQQGTPASAIFRVDRPLGSSGWLRAQLFPVTTHGVVHRFVGLVEDITEERRRESQLLQSQRMEAVGRLAGGIAHDFNNLLTVILGSSQLLEEDVAHDRVLADRMREISRAAESAAALTSQLLAFSRQQVLQPRALDLSACVRKATPLLRRLIGEHLELRFDLTDPLQAVSADPAQMDQVLINLVANARDAMPTGGTITIATGHMDLSPQDLDGHPAAATGPHVWLSIADTGLGMDLATQRRVFEPFFTTKTLGKGTGLGLATVYGIVKQSRGFIEVESTVGRGTTFRIMLPILTAGYTSVERNAPRVSAEGLHGDETILLVEDRAETRRAIRDMLRHYGYRVLEAASGVDALQVAGAHDGPIHLLLTDVVMPGLSGRDTADQLTATYPDLRVVFMSGYTNETIDHHGVLDPGIEFIQKPFTLVDLMHKVRRVLGADEA
jgi:PAS domain S-box-containing protein